MRSRVFLKLLGAFVLVIAIATAILDFAVRREWEASLRQQITESLAEKTRMFAERVEANGGPSAQLIAQQSKAADARATVINAMGHVLADSEADPDKMENHAMRPEFVAALSDVILIPHASPAGKAETVARQVLQRHQPLFTFDHAENKSLLELGAHPYHLDEILRQSSSPSCPPSRSSPTPSNSSSKTPIAMWNKD